MKILFVLFLILLIFIRLSIALFQEVSIYLDKLGDKDAKEKTQDE